MCFIYTPESTWCELRIRPRGGVRAYAQCASALHITMVWLKCKSREYIVGSKGLLNFLNLDLPDPINSIFWDPEAP